MNLYKPLAPSGGEYLEIPSTLHPVARFLSLTSKCGWAVLCVLFGISFEQWAETCARKLAIGQTPKTWETIDLQGDSQMISYSVQEFV